MAKTINIDILSTKSIKEAIKEIEKYRDELQDKCKQIVERLAQIGLSTATPLINSSELSNYITIKVKSGNIPNGFKAVLIASGEVQIATGFAPFSTILAIEFGAGIALNPIPNPKSSELGYGVGTFPNQIHAFDKDGWYYWSESSQQWVHTLGIKATMPMYYADTEILLRVEQIVKDVFN